MKKFKLFSGGLILALGLGVGSVNALEMNDITVGGHYLGGLNFIRQANRSNATGQRVQFDFAANLDFEFMFSDNWKGVAQLQTSPGAGSFGFPGPGAELTDINIVYTNSDRGYEMTMGSFDTPFGQQTPYLTNNADTLGNALLFNDLLYSAFAGPVGTLNTLGIMTTFDTEVADITVAVTNGTDESAANPDGGFEYVLSVVTDQISEGLSVGVSYMNSDDSESTGSGFNTALQGTMIDAHYSIGETLHFKSYFAMFDYGDKVSATEDKVTAWAVEGRKAFDSYFVSGRVSGWSPEDNDGTGAGMSADLPNPGFAVAHSTVVPVADQNIIRYQIGAGFQLEENVVLKAEVFMDDYAEQSTDVKGLACFINAAF